LRVSEVPQETEIAEMLVRMNFPWHPDAIAVSVDGIQVSKEAFDRAFEDSIPLGEQ
jgi:hypothetical protein